MLATPAVAAPVANPIATFSGLDKITARITNFDVYLNETVQFGSLQITPRVCYTQPTNDTQQRTAVFVEVDQVSLKGATERIFTGWMFADSPALNAVDDPVYDFWLVDCKQSTNLPPPTAINPEPPPDKAPPARPLPKPATAQAEAPPTNSGSASAPAGPVASESGSIITLINPNPTAETSPDQ
jgi:hypothetical protein